MTKTELMGYLEEAQGRRIVVWTTAGAGSKLTVESDDEVRDCGDYIRIVGPEGEGGYAVIDPAYVIGLMVWP